MLYIHGLGHYHPENVITNRFIEELDIGSSDEWIRERVGILARRTALSLEYIRATKNRDPRAAAEASCCTNARSGALAAAMALERASIGPEDIGLVISGSSASDHLTPAEAATVAGELGIEAPCLDLNSACSPFGMQALWTSWMRPEKLPPFVLLVQPENLTRCVDYSDRRIAPLFGDGSSAAVVSATVPSRLRLADAFCDSAPSQWDKVRIPRFSHFNQNGNAVQGFAIRRSTDSLRRLQETYGTGPGSFVYIGHQANFGMLQTVCERCGIEEANHWFNVVEYGNTGCSSAPAVLSQRWDNLREGDTLAMVLVGSGLSWASLLFTVEGAAER